MRILVYGAGNMGSLYAALLQQAEQQVSILARGRRLSRLQEFGIELQNSVSGERTTTFVDVVEHLKPEDAYDLVLVMLPKNHVRDAVPILARNRRTPSLLFMCNNAEGPGAMIDALGRDRVLLGFPGAGAVSEGCIIRYLITSAREQPTTIGEVDGRRSTRIEQIAETFKRAGFPVAICSNMDAWLKTHVAEISPTANALFMAGGDPGHLAENPDALRLMLRAIREGYRVLRTLRIPITPGNHRIFEWLPQRLLLTVMRRKLTSEEAAIKIGHALGARTEMKLLAQEFQALARRTSVATPAIDRLYEYVDADAGAAAGESPEVAVASGRM
jgi:2-dehydropantoate 2-reductase